MELIGMSPRSDVDRMFACLSASSRWNRSSMPLSWGVLGPDRRTAISRCSGRGSASASTQRAVLTSSPPSLRNRAAPKLRKRPDGRFPQPAPAPPWRLGNVEEAGLERAEHGGVQALDVHGRASWGKRARTASYTWRARASASSASCRVGSSGSPG